MAHNSTIRLSTYTARGGGRPPPHRPPGGALPRIGARICHGRRGNFELSRWGNGSRSIRSSSPFLKKCLKDVWGPLLVELCVGGRRRPRASATHPAIPGMWGPRTPVSPLSFCETTGPGTTDFTASGRARLGGRSMGPPLRGCMALQVAACELLGQPTDVGPRNSDGTTGHDRWRRGLRRLAARTVCLVGSKCLTNGRAEYKHRGLLPLFFGLVCP